MNFFNLNIFLNKKLTLNENLKKEIKINPKDLNKISKELILNRILKDGSIIILDKSIPSQEINFLFNYYK